MAQWWERSPPTNVPARCKLWVEFVVVFALLWVSPGFLYFLALQKPTSPNSNSTRIEDPHENQADVASFLNIAIHLFLKCICPARDPPFYRKKYGTRVIFLTLNTRFLSFHPASEKCSMLQSEYDELESEHERLTARHSKLIQDIDNKEAHWKDRWAFFTRFIHRGCGLNLTDRKKQKTFIPFPGFMQALLPAAVKEGSPRSSPELFGEERTPDSKERRKSILGFMPFWNVFIITV